MCQTTLLRHDGDLFTYSWTTGVRKVTYPKPKTEDDVLALALFLEKQGLKDKAEEVLEKYCR